jgi:hypothetical protein
MEPGRVHGIHRSPRVGERDGNVEQELARRGLGDDGSLVADDELVEARLLEIGPYRPEHATGHDDDVDSRCTRSRERLLRPRLQHAVLGDQRPVEVEREGGDRPRKALRELERYGALPPVDLTT